MRCEYVLTKTIRQILLNTFVTRRLCSERGLKVFNLTKQWTGYCSRKHTMQNV